MHSPLSRQELAHLRDVSGPLPVRTMSITPLMTSVGATSLRPAGSTLGHTSTHLPQRVQASSISSTRAVSADSKVVAFMRRYPKSFASRQGNASPGEPPDRKISRIHHRHLVVRDEAAEVRGRVLDRFRVGPADDLEVVGSVARARIAPRQIDRLLHLVG